ncbi:MAG TPA: 30S ribosomal protein S16 [Stellaceae bacterium]|nr:30S ribosomal protein S16 [Stellaceae bacterium]
MALKIRLARGGAKNRPFYSIVVADSRSPRDGRFIEKLGTYNPMLDKGHKDRVVLKSERIQHWIKMGALPSERVTLFLADAGMMKRPEIRETPQRSMPRAERKKLDAAKAEAPAAAGPGGAAPAAPPAEAKAEKKPEAAPAASA